MLLLEIILFKDIVIGIFMKSADKYHSVLSGYFVVIKFNLFVCLFLLAQFQILK